MKNKEKNFISAVIYVRNEEKQIANMLATLNRILGENFEKFEIICVDDASVDSSIKMIKSYAQEHTKSMITIVSMGYYQGIEHAMNAGVDLSIGDFVYEFDSATIDYEENLIMDIYYKLLEGYDIVKAIPNIKLKFFSKIFYDIFNHYSGSLNQLTTERFRIISRRAINRIYKGTVMIEYRKAIYATCGLDAADIKYSIISHKTIEKKEKDREYRWNLAIDSLILFTDVAENLSQKLVMLMMGLTLITGIYAVIIKINGNPVSGWTTIILFMSFGFFCIFTILSIMIKYLSLITRISYQKQKYIIESVEKITK